MAIAAVALTLVIAACAPPPPRPVVQPATTVTATPIGIMPTYPDGTLHNVYVYDFVMSGTAAQGTDPGHFSLVRYDRTDGKYVSLNQHVLVEVEATDAVTHSAAGYEPVTWNVKWQGHLGDAKTQVKEITDFNRATPLTASQLAQLNLLVILLN